MSDDEKRREAVERLLGIDDGPVGSPEEMKDFISDTRLLHMLKTLGYPEDAERIKALEGKISRNPLSREAD